MATIHYEFDEVSVKHTKRWTDENGKRRQETRTFFQTLNPYNRLPDGTPKSRQDIMVEITAARDSWIKEGTPSQ